MFSTLTRLNVSSYHDKSFMDLDRTSPVGAVWSGSTMCSNALTQNDLSVIANNVDPNRNAPVGADQSRYITFEEETSGAFLQTTFVRG